MLKVFLDQNKGFKPSEQSYKLESELQNANSPMRVEQLQTLSEVIDSMTHTIDAGAGLESICSIALTALQRALGIERSSIFLFDPDGVIRFKAWLGIADDCQKAIEKFTSSMQGICDAQPIIIDNLQKALSLSSVTLALKKGDIRAFAYIPLMYGGKLLGRFILCSRERYRFEKEIEFAIHFGKLVAFGIVHSQANHELRVSEEAFRATFELSENGKVLLSAYDGHFVRVNSKFSEMTGYSPEELKSKVMLEITHPDDRKESEIAFQNLMGGLPSHVCERRFLRKDGGLIWVSVSSTPIRDKSGKIINLVATIQDITDRKVSEEEKLKTLRKYQSLIDSIDGIVWEVTPDFRFTFVSKQAEHILGYPVDQWMAEPDFWANHIHPDDRAWAVEFCISRTRLLQDHDFEYRMIAADGRVIWVRDLVHVVVEKGELLGLRGVMMDITVRVKADVELRILSDRLRKIMVSISDCLWSVEVDQSGNSANFFASPVIEKITGRTPGYYVGGLNRWFTIVHVTDCQGVQAAFQRIVNRQSVYEELDYRILLPDGSFRWVRNSLTASLLDRGGLRIDGVVSDITERKIYLESRERLLTQETHARKEAERAIELRDDFLSIAAHELRTPLTPLRMYFQLIVQQIETLGLEPKKADALSKAAKGTQNEFDRFLKLVENLLDVTRIRAGRIILERWEFDLSELVKSVTDRFESALKKAKCELHLDRQSPLIGRWDQSRIEQVVINLLTNAMKYGAQKPIEITVSKRGTKAVIEVTDHGIGIRTGDKKKYSIDLKEWPQSNTMAGLALVFSYPEKSWRLMVEVSD